MSRFAVPALAAGLLLAGCGTTAPARHGTASRPGERWSEADLPQADAEPPRPRVEGALSTSELPARLSVRARSHLGRRGPFQARGQRFGSDCSGFVEAVYAAEGLLLRDLMQEVAPDQRSGVAAAWHAARAHGRVFGADEWPVPGDLVFWHDTYDRNRNGRTDDRFTHLGIVEYVEDGSVYFLHRGGRGVARGVMTPGRPHQATDGQGRRINSAIRATTHPVKAGGLAGALFAGYGRIDPQRVPAEYAGWHVDPYLAEDYPTAPATPTARETPPEPGTATPAPTATATPAPAPAPTPTAASTAPSTRSSTPTASAPRATTATASSSARPARRASSPAPKSKGSTASSRKTSGAKAGPTRTASKAGTAGKSPKRKRTAAKKAAAPAKPPVVNARTAK